MKKGRDAGFSSKRSGNAGSGPPLPDPVPGNTINNAKSQRLSWGEQLAIHNLTKSQSKPG